MIEQVKIKDKIAYIKASEEPLSADVVLIEGQEYLYVFDVGNDSEVAEYLNAIPRKKRIILSHFHPDHMGNIGRVKFDTVFCGTNTEKYLQNYIEDYARYETVMESVKIEDGVSVEIHPVPNSHAKGALLLQVDGEYLFLGDSLYSKVQGDNYVYNAQLLKEEIGLLKELPAETVFSSHEKNPLKKKAGVVRFLEQVYEKRQKNDAYIRIERV